MADSIRGPGHVTDVVAVDRSSPVPLYYQVAQALQGAIEAGRLAPGLRLDNEIQLADDLGLSRPTMRRAMEYLVEQGLIIRRRGVGTTIVQPRVGRPRQLTSLYDDLEVAGLQPSTAALSLGVAPPPPAPRPPPGPRPAPARDRRTPRHRARHPPAHRGPPALGPRPAARAP